MRGLEQAKYQAERSFKRRIAEKETLNPAVIAKVGNGAGTVIVPGRSGWIYVRLHGDDNQLTEAKLGIPLDTGSLNDAWVRVKKASPRKASYYAVQEFITSSGGDPEPPTLMDAVKITLINRTGGGRTAGDVVVTDPDDDESFVGTAAVGYQGKVLVVAATIADLTGGLCWERGGPFDVKVTGAVERNDGLRTSATIHRAAASPSITGGGVFAVALSPNITGEGTVKAVFLDAVGGGGGGDGAGTIEVQEDDAKVADAGIVNFEGGGGKVTDEGGGKVTVDITPGGGDGGAWTLIEDVELGAPAATIDFQNIPGTHKHLKILCSLRTDDVDDVDLAILRLNNSAVGYDWLRYQIGSLGLTPTNGLNDTEIELGMWLPATTSPAGSFGGGQIFIPDYTNSAKLQGVECSGGSVRAREAGKVYASRGWGEWRTTSAITRVTLLPLTGNNFVVGSRATLYGIS